MKLHLKLPFCPDMNLVCISDEPVDACFCFAINKAFLRPPLFMGMFVVPISSTVYQSHSNICFVVFRLHMARSTGAGYIVIMGICVIVPSFCGTVFITHIDHTLRKHILSIVTRSMW